MERTKKEMSRWSKGSYNDSSLDPHVSFFVEPNFHPWLGLEELIDQELSKKTDEVTELKIIPDNYPFSQD